MSDAFTAIVHQLNLPNYARTLLLRLTRGTQAGVERQDRWITAGRRQRGHVQSRSDQCPPSHATPATKVPLSWLRWATPTRAAICWRDRIPNSGRCGSRVMARIGSTSPPWGALKGVLLRPPHGTLRWLRWGRRRCERVSVRVKRCRPGSFGGRAQVARVGNASGAALL